MNGVDEYSNYLGPEPTDEQISKRADEILEKMSYEEIAEKYWQMFDDTVGELLLDRFFVSIIEDIEDKLRNGEIS